MMVVDAKRYRSSRTLPWAGGAGDQDARFWDTVDLVGIVEAGIAEWERKRLEESK